MFGFDDGEFKLSTGIIFVALLVFGFIPIIGLIRYIPFFKEIMLGAIVVAGITSISDVGEGVKFALATGMIAAILFNIIYIPSSFVFGGIIGAASESSSAGGVALFSGLNALANLIGLIFMSPIGYTIGGAAGSLLN